MFIFQKLKEWKNDSFHSNIVLPRRYDFASSYVSKLTQSSERISVQFSENDKGTHHYILVMFRITIWIQEFSSN